MIVIMQRIHYHDLSGYLLRGGSGEKWHHLNLPVIIGNSQSYAAQYPENTHAIPIDHGLPDGWLWPFKHNESHRTSLFSHRRTAEAQYMQKPRRFNAEGALWNEQMISAAHELQIKHDKVRTVVAIDPQATNSDEGGDMAEETLRNAGFKGRIIRVHASKGKYARAEPISALYEQGRVLNQGNLYVLENQLMEYIPTTAKKSPDRLDAMVYALTELNGSQPRGMMLPKRLQ